MDAFNYDPFYECLPKRVDLFQDFDHDRPGNKYSTLLSEWGVQEDLQYETWFEQFIHVDDLDNMPTSVAAPDENAASIRQSTHRDLRPLRRRKRANRHSDTQLRALRDWVKQHIRDPYLDASSLDDLANETGLSKKQITTYLANCRRRDLRRIGALDVLEHTKPNAPPVTLDFDQLSSAEATFDTSSGADRSRSPCSTHSVTGHISDDHSTFLYYVLGPRTRFSDFDGTLLEWYIADSAPDHLDSPGPMRTTTDLLIGSAMSAAAKRPVNNYGADCVDQMFKQERGPAPEMKRELDYAIMCRQQQWSAAKESARNKHQDRRSEAGSAASKESRRSFGSAGSAGSHASLGSRKGRRTFRVTKPVVDSPQQRHICEYCQKAFNTKYLKDRHVYSLHEPKDVWFCRQVSLRCPFFCREHVEICRHRFVDCWKRPPDDRFFYRKDLIKQHLEGFHGVSREEITNEVLGSLNRANVSVFDLLPTTQLDLVGARQDISNDATPLLRNEQDLSISAR